MRKIITKEEALDFISRIPYISTLQVQNERNRREVYKSTLASAKLEGYVSIIKTVYLRREEVAKNRRRISEADADYEKKAKFCLYSELATVFGIEFSEVEDFIADTINAVV